MLVNPYPPPEIARYLNTPDEDIPHCRLVAVRNWRALETETDRINTRLFIFTEVLWALVFLAGVVGLLVIVLTS